MNNNIAINPDNVYTKSAYHKETGLARATIDRYIKERKIKTMSVNGVTLIIKG